MSKKKVEIYIRDTWEKTIRYVPEDKDTLIGLPFPYSIVGVKSGVFEEMYYWDTYFTNLGLLLSGYEEQAKNNVSNMLYLVEKYGFMPNGNRTYYLTRSQPPFLSEATRDVYNVFKDKQWLAGAYRTLEKEYAFWQNKRMTQSGLNRYFGEDTDLAKNARSYSARLHLEQAVDSNLIESYAHSYQAGAESGWDFSSRCGLLNHQYNWVDLNSLLYGFEMNMGFFSRELKNGDEVKWIEVAERRKSLINALMWNEKLGAFCDYDFVNKKQANLVSIAMFYPMYVGLATSEQATTTVKLLNKLESRYGVASTESREDLLQLQWDFPHGWPCLQYIVMKALMNYGYKEDAKRIAQKYIAVVDYNFEKTGQLWEKYNVVSGEVSVTKEYNTAPMMGWSAAVYLFSKQFYFS